MRKSIIFIILIFTNSFGFAQINIGVVIDGPWEQNDVIREMLKEEISVLTEGEFDVQFPDDKIIIADWTQTGVKAAIDQLFADRSVDLILAMGVLASGEVSWRGDLPKPVIAPFVIDAELQGLPSKNGASGVKNLNYLSLPARVPTDIKAFREIVAFDTITILINNEVWQSMPQLGSRTQSSLEEMGIEPVLLPVERTIDSALNALTPDVEAVYVAPLLHLLPGEFDRLVVELKKRRIASFSLLGRNEVVRGLMATVSPDFFPKIARRVALNLQRILLGEEPGTIPTAFAIGERLIINMETARAIGVSPPFTVLTEAEQIGSREVEIKRSVNLATVMQEAIAKNLDLAAERKNILAGQENVHLARSQLLPQIHVSGLGLLIDDDRAAASFGSQTERSFSGAASARQLIFSERAWANLSIQKDIQKAREYELQQLTLDIIQEAAAGYLNVLRAKTFETVQKENLRRTRSNFELAKVRKAIGYSGPSEVFRWESEIANDRREVIEAIAQRNLAEIALNRVLHRPAEEPFRTEEADLNDPVLGANREGLLDYFDDPTSFDAFREFMSQEGLVQSPEILALDAAISAKQRELRSARNSFWAPTVALQAEVTHLFNRGGAGTSGISLPPSLPISFPQADDTNWSIGLNFSYPIFEGGARFAERTRASEELHDLQLTRESIQERIEQQVRSALHVAGASRAGIQLSRDAATAANKNLDLVTDGYSRGAWDILDLLDAQNVALNADLAAASAIYDFLKDLIGVERAIGGFYFFMPPKEQDAWFERLEDFFKKAGVSPEGR